MPFRVLVASAALALVGSLPATAQRQGSVEIGGFLAYANADNSLVLGNTIAFGGRVGAHPIPVLSIELDISRASKSGAQHRPLHVWVIYNAPPAAETEFLLGAGYVRNSYSGTYEADDSGISAMAGARHPLREMIALRIDGYVDFVPNPANKNHQVPFNGNWAIRVGVSALLNR